MARKVLHCSTASIYVEAPENATHLGKVAGMYQMPHGHCMFESPWEYGSLPCNDAGVPNLGSEACKAETRAFITSAMRRYWEVASRPHTWREIYPDRSDARAAAVSIARIMSDRGWKF